MPVSLRDHLAAAHSGSQVVAYLTLGDPPGRSEELASEVIQAGALALELGFPHPNPLEGAVLQASHARALAAGVTTPLAIEMLAAIARRHPETPLVAIVQWSGPQSDGEVESLLDGLAGAGAAAVLAVGLPLWGVPALAEQVHRRGMQTVVACAPDSSRTRREITFRFTSGAIYVPRGRVTGGEQAFSNIGEFCQQITAETDLPIIVGVGIRSADDVAEICATPAKAAAVGTALVDHVAKGGAAGQFVKELLGR
jgi:tryptophan synthase alpha chain